MCAFLFFYVSFKIMRPLLNTLIYIYIILKNYIHNLLGKMKKKYLRFQEANLWPQPCGFHVPVLKRDRILKHSEIHLRFSIQNFYLICDAENIICRKNKAKKVYYIRQMHKHFH